MMDNRAKESFNIYEKTKDELNILSVKTSLSFDR
jgi:hypothetical protein